MKRILVISWFFPPVNSSEGLVTFKLLNNSCFEYDVYMQKNNSSWSYGTTEELPVNQNIHCIESNANDMEEYKISAVEYFKNNASKYDIIMTRSMPEITHQIGLEIKKINKDIIWIASFGDPIGNNPFTIQSLAYENPYSIKSRYRNSMGIKEIFSPLRIIRSWRYNRNYHNNYKIFIKNNNILQKSILNNCDFVIYNNAYQKDYMLNGYFNKKDLDKKSIILPHSFDDSLYIQEAGIKRSSKIIFTYVGHLDDIRTPHQLLLAIRKLLDYDKNVSHKVEFRFYGNLSDKEKLFIIDADLLDVVKINKPITYLESLKVMQNADWLIHIDANISDIVDENIFFAAKLADYMGSSTNIFGITMIKGVSANILRDYNALVVENNMEEIFNYLYLIVFEGYSKTINNEYRRNYSAVKVASKFDECIKNILGGKKNG